MIASDGKDLGSRFIAGSVSEITGFQLGDGSNLNKKFGKKPSFTTTSTQQTSKVDGDGTSPSQGKYIFRGINFPDYGGSSDIGQLSVDSNVPHINCDFTGLSMSLDF